MKSLIILLAGMALALSLQLGNQAIAKKTKTCHYSYITDGGSPEIGEDGKIEYDSDWKGVLGKGFRLHTAFVTGSGQRPIYIFEKCR